MNKTDQSLAFLAQIRQQKLLSQYQLFNKLKFRNIERGELQKVVNGKARFVNHSTDATGGFVSNKGLKKLSSDLGYNWNTFRKLKADLVNLGWLYECKTGYKLISQERLIKSIDSNLELKKIIIYGKDKKELNENIALSLIKNSISQQVFKRSNGESKHWNKKKLSCAKTTDLYTLSTRTMMKRMGYKTPATISRLQRKLEVDGKLKVERRNTYVCTIKQFPLVYTYDRSLKGCCFKRDGAVYKRECNNLIVL